MKKPSASESKATVKPLPQPLTHDEYEIMMQALRSAHQVEGVVAELNIKRAGLLRELGELSAFLESQNTALKTHRQKFDELFQRMPS